MPTTSSGSITPGTGAVTYPSTDTTSISSTSSSSSSSSNSGQKLTGVTGVNLGSGEGIYAGSGGTTSLVLDFRSLVAGAGISIDTTSETLTITATGVATPELNSLNGVLGVNKGGTGATSFTAGALILGQGSSAFTSLVLPTAANQYLSFDGSNYVWAPIAKSTGGTVTSVNVTAGPSGYITVNGDAITTSGTFTVDFNPSLLSLNNISGTLSVTKGGTGLTSLPSNGILVGNGTGTVQSITAPTTVGQVLTYTSSGMQWATPAAIPTNYLTSVTLTGDTVTSVTGGSVGNNAVAYSIATNPSGVNAGTYVNPTIQVDQYGRVISAANGVLSAVTAVNENNGGGARIFDDSTSTATQFNFRRIQTSSSLSATENTGYVMLDLNTVPVTKGGTGATSFTSNGVLVGNGNGAITSTPAPSTAGTALTWNGSSYVWNSSLQDVTIVGTSPITINQGVDANNQPTFVIGYDASQTSLNNLGGTLGVAKGGTGAASFAANGLLVGNGTGTVSTTPAPSAANTVLTWNGSAFVWSTAQSGGLGAFTIAGDSSVSVSNGYVAANNAKVTIGVAPSGVSAGTYSYPTIAVDNTGRITSAQSNTLPVVGAANYAGGASVYDNTTAGNTLNFRSLAAGSNAISVTQSAQSISIDANLIPVSKGGTGATTLPANGVLIGNDTGAVTTTPAPTTAGTFLNWTGTGYTFTNALTNVTVSGTNGVSVTQGTDTNGQPTFNLAVNPSQLTLSTLSGTLPVASGGTGLNTVNANQILVGGTSSTLSTIDLPQTAGTTLQWNGSRYIWAAPTNGTVTYVELDGSDGIVINGNPITSSGAYNISLDPSQVDLSTLAGTLTVAQGGTGATSFTANSILVGNGTGNIQTVPAPTDANSVLTWDGSAFAWTAESEATGTVTSVAIAAGSNAITVSGSPITTNGTITIDVNQANLNLANISGVTPVTSGGTGLGSIGAANQALVVNSDASGLAYVDVVTSVTAGSNKVTVSTNSGVASVDVDTTKMDVGTMTGVLGVEHGGTGISSLGPSGTVLTVNADGTGFTFAEPASGTGTGGSGTVTSVGIVSDSSVISVSNSPITVSGNMHVNFVPSSVDVTSLIANLGTSGQVLTVNQAGTGLEWTTVSANGTGTVTSVGLTAGSSAITVSGSPITSSGSITVDVNQSALDLGSMSGTVGVAHGGTGLVTLGTAGQVLTVNQDATAVQWNTLSVAATDVTGLATVATSGSYDDLSNKPSIPAAQVNSDWNASSGIAQILNKPTLATVATTGEYSDLVGTPTFATVATTGNYSDLNGIPAPYSLPIASADTLGGIKVGANLSIDANGVLSATTSGSGSDGTVTSVAVAAGSSKVIVSGSPITSSGTITLDVDTTQMDVSTMAGTLDTTHGGTGLSSLGAAGQVLTVNANGTGLQWTTPSTGTGTVTSVGLVAGSNAITVTGSAITTSGSFTVDVNQANLNIGNMTGTLGIAHGGTGLTSLGTAGQVLTVNAGATAATWSTLSVSAQDVSGLATVATSGSYDDLSNKPTLTNGTVTSVGLTAGSNKVTVSGSPITSSGNFTVDVNPANIDLATLGGTLGTTQGGTGLTTLGAPGQVMVVNSAGTGLQWSTPEAGGGSGTVTSVGITAGSNAITVSGGPITSSGNITVDVDQANLNISNMSGTLGVANGGTGATTLTGLVYGNGTSAMTAATGAQIASALGTTNIAGNAANVTGTVAVANGGTGLTSLGTAGQVLTVNSAGTGLQWSTPSTSSGSGGSNPAGSVAAGYYSFTVVLNPGGTAVSSVGNIPSGWTINNAGAGVLNITHNVGRAPYAVYMYAASATSGGGSTTWNVMPSTYSAGTLDIPDSGNYSPSTTQFNCTVTQSISKGVANGTVLLQVMF